MRYLRVTLIRSAEIGGGVYRSTNAGHVVGANRSEGAAFTESKNLGARI